MDSCQQASKNSLYTYIDTLKITTLCLTITKHNQKYKLKLSRYKVTKFKGVCLQKSNFSKYTYSYTMHYVLVQPISQYWQLCSYLGQGKMFHGKVLYPQPCSPTHLLKPGPMYVCWGVWMHHLLHCFAKVVIPPKFDMQSMSFKFPKIVVPMAKLHSLIVLEFIM